MQAMTSKITARQALRTATAEDHERVDRAFSGFDLADRDSYAAFLQAQAVAFLPVEAAIDAANPQDLMPDWPQRRRASLLRADFDALGIEAPGAISPPRIAGAEEILGAIYVLEGSRLGGQLLARQVPAGFPRAFIGASDPARWRKLIEMLDSTLVSEQQRQQAIYAARMVFGLFEDGARRFAKDSVIG